MLYLHGIGHCHPKNVVDNAFLESLNIETNDAWILDRVGIRERRTTMSLDYLRETYNKDPREAINNLDNTSAEMIQNAVTICLQRASLTKESIGMVVAGGCSSEFTIPPHACMLAGALGLEVPAFDLNSACSTFVMQLHLLAQMEALPDYVLVLIPESWTRTVDYSDRRTAVLTGDAYVAAIVSRTQPSPFIINNSFVTSDPKGWEKAVTLPGKHFVQEGRAIQKFAIKKTLSIVLRLRETLGMAEEAPYFIGHQANLTMLQSVCRRAEIAEDKHLYNVDQYGNCAAAGAPSVISQNWDKFKNDDAILLAVVGAGLTWGGLTIQVKERS
jgi:3-oxoacyl-[acyl-carrier-protein] synthase-3